MPGGAAKDGESRKEAALRELHEETSLKGGECTYLFEFTSRLQRNIKGGLFRDAHKVFLITASGTAEPQNEVQHVAYTKDPNVNLSYAAKRIVKKYFEGRVEG